MAKFNPREVAAKAVADYNASNETDSVKTPPSTTKNGKFNPREVAAKAMADYNASQGDQEPAKAEPAQRNLQKQQGKQREKAGLGAYFTSGVEEMHPATMAINAARGLAQGEGKGGWGKAADVVDYLSDPNKSMTGQMYSFDEPATWGQKAAQYAGMGAGLLGGGFLTQIGKLAGKGIAKGALGLAKARTGLKGAEGAAEALTASGQAFGEAGKKLLKGSIYQGSKLAPAMVGGTLAAKAADIAANKTGLYDNLTDEEKAQRQKVYEMAGGLLGGAGMAWMASKAVKGSTGLSAARDWGAEGLNLPSYKTVAEAKARQEAMNTPEVKAMQQRGEVPVSETTPTTGIIEGSEGSGAPSSTKAAATQAEFTKAAQQALKHTKDYSFQILDELTNPIREQKVGNMANKELQEARTTIATERGKLKQEQQKTPVALPNSENNVVTMPLHGEAGIEYSPKGTVKLDIDTSKEGVNKQIKSGEFDQNVNSVLSTINELKNVSKDSPALQEGVAKHVEQAQDYLGKISQTEHGQGALENYFNKELGLNPELTNQLKTDGKFDAAKISDAMEDGSLLSSSVGLLDKSNIGKSNAAEYITQTKQRQQLTDRDAQEFTKPFATSDVNSAEYQQAKQQLNENTREVTGKLEQDMQHLVSPVDKNTPLTPERQAEQQQRMGEMFEDISKDLTRVVGKDNPNFMSDLLTKSNDTNLPYDQRISALSDLGSILNHSSKLLDQPQPAGFGHGPLASKLRGMVPDLRNQIEQMKLAEWSEANKGKQIPNTEVARIRAEAKKAVDRDSLANLTDDNGKSVFLLNHGRSPSEALYDVADSFFNHNSQFGMNVIEGRDVPPATFLSIVDRMFKSRDTSSMTYGEVENAISALNNYKKYHKEAGGALDPLINKLKNTVASKLEEHYGETGKGQQAKELYQQTKDLQRRNLEATEEHPVFRKPRLGEKNQAGAIDWTGTEPIGAHLETSRSVANDVGIKAAEMFGKEFEGLNPLNQSVNDAQTKFREIANAGKKFNEYQKKAFTTEGMERGVGEVFKGKDWNDMLGGFGEVHGGTSKNQLEGLNFGKSVASGNPKVTDFLRYSAEKLQSEDFTPKAAAKMKEQLQSDVNSSFQKHIDDIASQGIEKGDYTNTAQNILKAMDNYQNLFNDEKRGGAALGDIMKDTPEYERFNDGDSRIVLEAIAKSEFGKVLDERIKKLGSNPLKELAQIARGSENVKNALLNKMRDETKKEHLSWDDLADPNKTKKNGLVKKMVGGIVSNHLFRMVYNAATQEAQAKHLSPAQIKGKVMHDIGERLSNPHMKDENGVSWADLVKQDYEKSIADLNKRRAPGRSALIGGVAGGKAAQD